MTVIATDTLRFSNVIKEELWPEQSYCRAVVTYNGTAATLEVGRVLGKVTATGKYKIALQAAADGSQTADAIVLVSKTVALNTDTPVLAMVRGPAAVSFAGLVLDASYSTQAHKDAVAAALEAKGIQVLTAF